MKLCISVWNCKISTAVLDLDEIAVESILQKRDKLIAEQQEANKLIEHVFKCENCVQYYPSVVQWDEHEPVARMPNDAKIDDTEIAVYDTQIHIQEDWFYFTAWSIDDERIETFDISYDMLREVKTSPCATPCKTEGEP